MAAGEEERKGVEMRKRGAARYVRESILTNWSCQCGGREEKYHGQDMGEVYFCHLILCVGKREGFPGWIQWSGKLVINLWVDIRRVEE